MASFGVVAVLDEILAANDAFVGRFASGDLPAAPARRLAVVTCMDARLDPAGFLGLAAGDAHVIRNAGGLVTDDALRSLVVSHWLLGTQTALVIGHEDCGLLGLSNEQLRRRLADATGADASDVDFLPFANLDESVRASVQRIRECRLLPESFGPHGFVYDVRTGSLRKVV